MKRLTTYGLAFLSLLYLGSSEISIGNLPHCVEEQQSSGYILVSTLDGKLTSLKANGDVAWEFETESGPLLTSNIHNVELTNNGEWVRLIPSLSGSLYKFNGETIDAIPINADNLLLSSHVYSNDLVIAGGRNVQTYGVVLKTGETLYECSADGCHNVTQWKNDFDDVVIVERSTITVRAHEPRTGSERWNFSVGYHNLKIPPSSCVNFDTAIASLNVTAVLPKGCIIAYSGKSTEALWHHQFSNPIVKIWKWDGHNLENVDVFKQPIQEHAASQSSPDIYLGMHDKQLYIYESERIWNNMQDTSAHSRVVDGQSLMRFPWKPISANKKQEEVDYSTAISVLYSSEYINGKGYYFHADVDVKNENSLLCSDNSTRGSSYWKMFNTAKIFNWLSATFIAVLLITVLWGTEFINILFRRTFLQESSNTLVPSEKSEPIKGLEPFRISISEENEKEFSSKFVKDFDVISVLGKGGYGTVFEVKRKFDEGSYAIKMVKLARGSDASKMLREIKALAQLDHANIVSYNTSWEETPPLGWKYDFFLHSFNEDSVISGTFTENAESDNDCVELNSRLNYSCSDSIVTFERSNETCDKGYTKQSAISKSNNFNVARNKKLQISYLFIQMQLCEKNTLKDWLRCQDSDRSKLNVYKIYRQILNAVEYIHSKEFIHRDLKPSNIFFVNDFNIKVADFGLVTPMKNPSNENIFFDQDNKSYTQDIGTYLYMSPEQKKCKRYDYKVDIFSLGVILFELLVPFATQSERIRVLTDLRNGIYPKDFLSNHPLEHALLNLMLSDKPRKRPTAKEVKETVMQIEKDIGMDLI